MSHKEWSKMGTKEVVNVEQREEEKKSPSILGVMTTITAARPVAINHHVEHPHKSNTCHNSATTTATTTTPMTMAVMTVATGNDLADDCCADQS